MSTSHFNFGPRYAERVYAGVLGKIIGVYLGRPIEGWKYRDIVSTFGELTYYVHEQRNVPLVVSDDDISGTFTFVRALSDYPHERADLTAPQIGQTWLNYIVEKKAILWWGGMGLSTEHTAFKRLLDGIPAPRSGSMAMNGQVVAEQIGAQIFIDAWAMVSPGRPDLAAEFARRAGSVSHDGEAIYAAQVIAAMEALAFTESDLNKLLDVGVSFIPKDSLVYRLIDDLRAFHARETDWQKAMTDLVEVKYGYDKYRGNCHVIPNHALIILALLYCEDSFHKALTIVNTLGWDTDCNSGNVGCLMGIKNGLAGIDSGPDFRTPVADRMYLPTADGASCITDAVIETGKIIAMAKGITEEAYEAPKEGARFHFTFPGSLQGFFVRDGASKRATLSNTDGRLAIHLTDTHSLCQIATLTFLPRDQMANAGQYALLATPTLVAGQTVKAKLMTSASSSMAKARLFVTYYGDNDADAQVFSRWFDLASDQETQLDWTLPSTGGQPVYEVGIEFDSPAATMWVDSLTWSGTPQLTLGSIAPTGSMWRRQWVDAMSYFGNGFRENDETQAFMTCQNDGRGLVLHGGAEWIDYTVQATVTPHLARACGLAARVQGLQRYYAILLVDSDGKRFVRLVKMLDGEKIVAELPFPWKWDSAESYELSLTVVGSTITARVGQTIKLQAVDTERPLDHGGIGLILEEGRAGWSPVKVGTASAK